MAGQSLCTPPPHARPLSPTGERGEMTTAPPGGRGRQWLSSRVGRLDFVPLPLDEAAELLHRPHVELADPLLRDAELLADLFERHALVVVEAGPQADDLALAGVEVVEQPVDLVGRL